MRGTNSLKIRKRSGWWWVVCHGDLVQRCSTWEEALRAAESHLLGWRCNL